jgi:hypothetical protein
MLQGRREEEGRYLGCRIFVLAWDGVVLVYFTSADEVLSLATER